MRTKCRVTEVLMGHEDVAVTFDNLYIPHSFRVFFPYGDEPEEGEQVWVETRPVDPTLEV